MVTNLAIMSDMSVVHQQHVITDARDHPSALSTTMDGGEFPNTVVIADFQSRRLTAIFQVLRLSTDRGELENPVARADNSVALDNRIGADPGFGSNPNLRANYRTRPNLHCR